MSLFLQFDLLTILCLCFFKINQIPIWIIDLLQIWDWRLHSTTALYCIINIFNIIIQDRRGSQFYGVQKQRLNNSLLRDGSASSLHVHMQYLHTTHSLVYEKKLQWWRNVFSSHPFYRSFCSTSFGKWRFCTHR